MITAKSIGITKLITLFRYLLILVGVYLAATLAFGLFALGVVDFGLAASYLTWLGVVILCVDLLLILYLIFAHLTGARSRSLVGLYIASVGLFISALISLWVSKDINDCAASDAFVICAVTGVAWKVIGFSLGSMIVLRLSRSL